MPHTIQHPIQHWTAKTKTAEKQAFCRQVLEALPDWFGVPEAITDYASAAKTQDMFVVPEKGFLTLKFHTETAVELAVMGVLPAYHGQGVGKALIAAATAHLQKNKMAYFTVKTLAESANSAPYDATRAFYASQGFVPLEVFPDLWDAHNPCLLMVKSL